MGLIFLAPLAVGKAFAGIDDGLVAHYLFNGNANDTSGTNNGIIFGNATFTNGINGLALMLSEEGDYVEIPSNTNISLNTVFGTISVWFKAGRQIHSQAAILDRTRISDYDLDLLTNSTPGTAQLRFRAYNGSNYQSISGLVPSSQWINAVVLKSGTNISLYTNANLMGTININSVLTKNNPLIVGAGGSPYVSGFGFIGLIEDLRLYNRALTTDEVQSLYLWSYPSPSISPGSSPGVFNITWNAIAGRIYHVQSSTNLSSTNWIDLGTSILATNGMLSVSDTSVAPASQKYYRVVLLP